MEASPHEVAAEKIKDCESVIRAALAEQLGWIAEIQRLGSYAEDGARSMRVWLRELLNISEAEAKNRVMVAAATAEQSALTGAALPTDFPATGTAIRAGEITVEHARAILDGIDSLPPAVTEEQRNGAEAQLVQEARRVPPRQIRVLAERIRYMLDQDGALRTEEYQIDNRELHFGVGHDGMTVVNGRLDREAGAKLRAVLAPLAAPRPEVDGTKDSRSAGKRHADALVTVLDIALGSDQVPRAGGARPQITVTIDYQRLQEQLAGTLETMGQPISAVQARRIACDAEILPIMLDGAGIPLDVGRTKRTAPPHLRAALLARDGTCAFPGCDHPPGTSEAHHVRSWLDGGRTALDNMVMTCAHHHRIVHSHRWEITFQDGRPMFIPPSWMDAARTPRPGGRPHHRSDLTLIG